MEMGAKKRGFGWGGECIQKEVGVFRWGIDRGWKRGGEGSVEHWSRGNWCEVENLLEYLYNVMSDPFRMNEYLLSK